MDLLINTKFDSISFFIIQICSVDHAFSITFFKNSESKYNVYFFNSGTGINMHPYDIEKKLFGCYLIKNNINIENIKNFLINLKKYYSSSKKKKSLEEIYDILIGYLFIPTQYYNSHKSKGNALYKPIYFDDLGVMDDVIYLKEQVTGNCSGRSLLYPLIIYRISLYVH